MLAAPLCWPGHLRFRPLALGEGSPGRWDGGVEIQEERLWVSWVEGWGMGERTQRPWMSGLGSARIPSARGGC